MKLSICIPSYNNASKIEQCLASILCSKSQDFEVIVCDSSADSSLETYVKLMKEDKRLKVMHSKRRVSCGSARNLAFKHSCGEYVFCMDIDDKLASEDALDKLLAGLDGKDIYFCSYASRKDKKNAVLSPHSIAESAKMPVAAWTKVYKRELYVEFPDYMPEDVWPHFLLVDKCKTFGYFDFAVVDYDNTPENKGAISRTFDWLLAHPSNLMQLAASDTLQTLGLREEFVAGVIHNLADMFLHRNDLKRPEVKQAFMQKMMNEYRNFTSGLYVH